ncbi:MAG: O-antigen ligase family protein, partial [Verrucomicrobiota bacterium]
FLAGLAVIGMVGTSTSMTFIWPGYFLIGLAAVFSLGSLFRNATFKLSPWTIVPMFTLFAYFMIRASESPVAYFAREDAALIATVFLVYAGFFVLCSGEKLRRAVLYALAGLVIMNLVLALVQWIYNPRVWILPGYERTHMAQPGGLFNQPDHFAGFLAALVPMWLAVAAFGMDQGRRRIAWVVLAAISALVVCFSGSMIGWLTLGFGLLGFAGFSLSVLWSRFRPSVRRRGLVIFGLLAVIGAALSYLLSGPIIQRLGQGLFSNNGAASLPLVWETTMKQVAKSPWVGTGSRSSYIYGRTYRSAELDEAVGEPEFAHNEFLQVLADYGVLGLVLVLMVLSGHYWKSFSFIRAYADVRPPPGGLVPRSQHLGMTLGAMSSVLALVCLAMFDFAMHLPIFAVVGSLLLAVMAAPDPMANALEEEPASHLPGGGLMFTTRAVAFGCGLAMAFMGVMFTRSEYHYEMARLAFEADSRDFKQFRHLQAARTLDPRNPFAFSLSAHAQVAGITSDMRAPERRQALEKADAYFVKAQKLYPQDVFAAVGHTAVLDELGKKAIAGLRLRDAREWAPLYGNLMLAQAEHHLRYGEVSEAESAYREALEAGAFRNSTAAMLGLRTISEWKLIAQQDGVSWEEEPASQSEDGTRTLPNATIIERDLSGMIPEETGPPNEDFKEQAPMVEVPQVPPPIEQIENPENQSSESEGIPLPPTW